jgi:hypothetical protein
VRSSVSDPEQGPGELVCRLEVELVHNNHTHPEPAIAACEADVTIDPVGCDGNYYAWRFTLTVTDPQGLETRDVSEIHPDCTPPVCGDGVVEAPEECDPPGDCCTAACAFEPDGTSCSDADECTRLDSCSAGTCSGTPLPDLDGDGVCDALDADDDGDGIPDAVDDCPFFASADVRDTDGDGRGDVCECTDQNGDGRNDVRDLIAINRAIFDPALVTPLCDGNDDGKCDVNDIIAANREIYSPTNTSTCARQPVPGP